jgi:hypothetical protein
MITPLQEYDLVALTEDMMATHKSNHNPLCLRRGQMGTILMALDKQVFLVDFTDQNGQTFAMEPVESSKLLKLISEPELVLV